MREYRLRRVYTRFVPLVVALILSACDLSAAPSSPFDGQRAFRDLKEIVAIGPRVPGTDGSAQARAIIRRELEAIGVVVKELPFEATTPYGVRTMTNVVATIEGTEDGLIVFGNHYDTKYFPDFEFVGANDGGSTTAWMIEFARALGPKREGYSIMLCWFDGEEALKKWGPTDSLYGSTEMVRHLREQQQLSRVKAMINLDMIGDCDLNVWKDSRAPAWMVNAVWDTAASLGLGHSFDIVSRQVDDDQLPFHKAGIPAMNLIDLRYGGSASDHDRNWHTVRDRIDLLCSDSLQVVGDVVFHALKRIEAKLLATDKPEHDADE